MLQDELVDIVLLDVLMPEMDGLEVLRHMKADGRLKHLPVIVISALEELDTVVRCIEMGAEDYLSKPFDPVLLRARLNAALAKKRLHDLELEYLEQVGHVAEAAAAVESGTFESSSLDVVAEREDADYACGRERSQRGPGREPAAAPPRRAVSRRRGTHRAAEPSMILPRLSTMRWARQLEAVDDLAGRAVPGHRISRDLQRPGRGVANSASA